MSTWGGGKSEGKEKIMRVDTNKWRKRKARAENIADSSIRLDLE